MEEKINENKFCEVCKKNKESTRFESLTENYICDSCLRKWKIRKTKFVMNVV
jgi:hypothetical protein